MPRQLSNPVGTCDQTLPQIAAIAAFASKHVFPNCSYEVVTLATLNFPSIIITAPGDTVPALSKMQLTQITGLSSLISRTAEVRTLRCRISRRLPASISPERLSPILLVLSPYCITYTDCPYPSIIRSTSLKCQT